MNELVKYGNQMNSVPFRKFNKRDLNIFFAIVSRMRDQGEKLVSFSFKKLIQLSGEDYHGHRQLFLKDLKSTYHKMQDLTMYYEDKDKYVSWVLFTRFEIDKRHRVCSVKVNPDLVGVLNNLAKQFTRFSLVEFSRLSSTYTKTIFRLIKQFRTTGLLELPVKRFRYLLSIPQSYDTYMIKVRIVRPTLIELSPLVHDLWIRRIKPHGRVVAYKITFTPESNQQDDFNKDNLMGEKWMIRNVKSNPHLDPRLQKIAISKIVNEPSINKRKIPMARFNQRLDEENRRQLQEDLKLYHCHYLYLTEYQVRKLRKAIRQA